MSKTTQELISPSKTIIDQRPKPATVWQEWTKKRAQNAPNLEQIKKITEKVKINVTQIVLDERQET